MSSRNNTKEVYDLLEKLCKNLAGEKHQEALNHVRQYISNCPTVLTSTVQNDEASLVSKICNHLSTNHSQNDVTLFKNLHEQLKACQTDHGQRSAILSFLLFLADAQKNSRSNGLDDCTNSVKSDYFSNARSVNSTKLDKMISHFGKKVPSSPAMSSDNNLAPMLRRSFNQQSDSSDSSSRDSNIKPHGGFSDLTEELVQNVIFAFTGIKGKFLKKDVIAGGFKLDPIARTLTIVQSGMLLRLSELGYYHDQVQSFADLKSGRCALGVMGQGFISALKNEITRYYGMVALLQEQLNRQKKNSISIAAGERLTLLKVLVWAEDPQYRLRWIATIAEACQEKKGGALASVVYEFLNNGDPVVKSLVRELLLAICGPLKHMLSRWILEGEIIDPHGEFFIECLTEVGSDSLWHGKYRVRSSMLPTFISPEMANKILVTGKSINFLREICQDKTPIDGRDELRMCLESTADSIFSKVADTKLHSLIDAIYFSTSKKVLDIVMGPHKLLEHLIAMRRYLLLGQGDFIGILMENLKSELDRPGKELYCYDLSSIMDTTVRSTNAQFDDPEILNHLDIRLEHPCDGDTGWDIISLNYTVRGPLSTMLEPSMHNYQKLFKPLWRMKHIEFVLSSKIWKEQMCNAKLLRSMASELNPIMYRLNRYASEMIHFIHQVQYYILFEVIECSWSTFLDKFQQAKALDDILQAHNEFLEIIKIGGFLDEKSEVLKDTLEDVFLIIMRLEIWQDKFFDLAFKELNARKQFSADIKESETAGEYGVTVEKRLERDEDKRTFEQYLINCQKTLNIISADYETSVRKFLLKLNSSNDHNLQLFGMRLDFNEYYKKRDQSLGVPLTFEHMRMSNIFFNNKSSTMNCSRFSTN